MTCAKNYKNRRTYVKAYIASQIWDSYFETQCICCIHDTDNETVHSTQKNLQRQCPALDRQTLEQ